MHCPLRLAVQKKMFKFVRLAQMSSAKRAETTTLVLLQMFLQLMNARSGVEGEMSSWATADI